MFKDRNMAENWTNMAENLKKLSSCRTCFLQPCLEKERKNRNKRSYMMASMLNQSVITTTSEKGPETSENSRNIQTKKLDPKG